MAGVGTSGTILVVEDEFFVRMEAHDVLTGAGLSVKEAGNASEAIAAIEADPSIDIVFTDIRMPGEMDGGELADLIRRRWPNIEIVITSGTLSSKRQLPEGVRVLPKPYSNGDLWKVLSEIAKEVRERN